jgi:hypothetical protein
MVAKQTVSDPVADILPQLTREMGWEKQLDLHSIFVSWNGLVGEEWRAHSRPLKIERGVLWLEVENSSWMQQFQYDKGELMVLLNRSLKLSRLKDIKMMLVMDQQQAREEEQGKVAFRQLTSEQLAAIESQAACIIDEKCREALIRFHYLAEVCRRPGDN